MSGLFRTNIAAPNLANVCIDSYTNYGSRGRVYNCYSGEKEFTDEFQLIKTMEMMMDKINYPQSSTNAREYGGNEKRGCFNREIPLKLMENDTVLKEKGDLATFLIHVMYRQHATWQGMILWKEKNIVWSFKSVLELMKIMEHAINIPA